MTTRSTPNCPHLHQISARAKVKFTVLQDLNTAIFELHNDLRVTKVLDEKDQPLAAERVTQDARDQRKKGSATRLIPFFI